MEKEEATKLREAAQEIRKDVIQMTYNVGGIGAHIGGSLSLCEIMAVLYLKILHFDPQAPAREDRDRFIISKGHGVMAQYAVFKQLGMITQEELYNFKKEGSWLTAHPIMAPERGIEFSTGSLGQGLGLGIGTAIALKKKGNLTSRVYVVLGDGECDEGSVWEGVLSAAQHGLDNLTVIVDKNGLQFDDKTTEIISLEDMEAKWKSFGWAVKSVDGHDVCALTDALLEKHDRPYAVIANTVKGKGVSFIENVAKWHLGRLSKEQYEQAMAEQEEK